MNVQTIIYTNPQHLAVSAYHHDSQGTQDNVENLRFEHCHNCYSVMPASDSSCSNVEPSLGSAIEMTQGKMTCETISSSWKSEFLMLEVIL